MIYGHFAKFSLTKAEHMANGRVFQGMHRNLQP